MFRVKSELPLVIDALGGWREDLDDQSRRALDSALADDRLPVGRHVEKIRLDYRGVTEYAVRRSDEHLADLPRPHVFGQPESECDHSPLMPGPGCGRQRQLAPMKLVAPPVV